MLLNQYAGAVHVHSVHSHDGRRSVDHILKSAKRAKLDFIMLTDHGNLSAKEREGWQDGVLLAVGEEITPRFNHYLVFGMDDCIDVREEEDVPPGSYVAAVAKSGGIGIIAHPDHQGAPLFHVKHYPWCDWSVSGFTGMGIWDFMTDWQSALTSFHRALWAYCFPASVLKGPRRETLSRWDSLIRFGPVVGVGELDNHDTLYSLGGIALGVFSFRRAFHFIRTYIFSETPFCGDRTKDISLLLSSLRRGRAFAALDYYKCARGFVFYLSDGEITAWPGDRLVVKGEYRVEVSLPSSGHIRIIRDGTLAAAGEGQSLSLVARDRGCYRVEVFSMTGSVMHPWIFSNHIVVEEA
ncbi:MAG: CehA/McbA family metallohydrolase [Deltaproteobacteria bacterium]|nr:CehA/McbA family metallohydrolase [Deltaproteobacteria bacterium]